MKKYLVYTFIFFYMASYLKPFIPSLCNVVSKQMWVIQHQHKVKNLEGRVNMLDVLTDMAKHNNPKPDNTPQPDSFKQVSIVFAGVIPQINQVVFFNTKPEIQFAHYISTIGLDFSTLSTPPPKFV